MFLWPMLIQATAEPSLVPDCITMELSEQWMNAIPQEPVPTRSGGVIDAYDLANSLTSEHAALLWSAEIGVDAAAGNAVLDAVEHAWERLFEELQYPLPVGSENRLFNVYVAGGEGPTDRGVLGYYNTDPEGWPMIVIAPDVIYNWPENESTIAHELMHAAQHPTESYKQDPNAKWYWEATAVWAEHYILPESTSYAEFLFGLGLRSTLPLSFFRSFSTGSLDEYHSYGAFIWLEHLVEEGFTAQDIRDSWVESRSSEPLFWWRTQLEGQGRIWADELSLFARKNVHWEYDDHELFQQNIVLAEELFGVTQHHSIDYAEGWPYSTGAASLHIANAPEQLELQFNGASIGDAFGQSEWRVWAISGAIGNSHELELSDEALLFSPQNGNVYISASVHTDNPTERVPFEIWMGEVTKKGPCQAGSCSSTTQSYLMIWWLGIWMLFRRQEIQ